MPDKHLSSQFDHELNAVSSRLMEMGGLVESQIQQAVYALSLFVEEVADQVIKTESQVNSLEVEIDRELSTIIARRQPTAKDLRLLMAISKATANLERAGDEANKIARMVKSLISSGGFRSLPSSELRLTSEMASGLLRKALDAFARLDTSTALAIFLWGLRFHLLGGITRACGECEAGDATYGHDGIALGKDCEHDDSLINGNTRTCRPRSIDWHSYARPLR